MDWTKVREALDACEQKIQASDDYAHRPQSFWWNFVQADARWQQLDHCIDMIAQMRDWPEDDIGKAFRWLGYIQGMMHAHGVADLEQLKEMNRPTEADKLREAAEASQHACSGCCGKTGPEERKP